MSSPPSYPRYDFGENLKNLAKAVAAVEFALFPFLIITFVLLDPIVRIATAMKLDLSATSEGLLAKQYLFFANHELISPRVASALLIFKVCMSICVIVVPLRLISGPLLFGTVNWAKLAKKDNSSIGRLLVLFFVCGVGCLWASMSPENASHASTIKALMFHWPSAFIGLEALSFVFGVVSLTEGLLACIELVLTRAR